MSVPFRNTKITISDADFYFKEILIKNLIPPFDTVVKNCNNGYELIHQLHRKIEDVFFIDLFTINDWRKDVFLKEVTIGFSSLYAVNKYPRNTAFAHKK